MDSGKELGFEGVDDLDDAKYDDGLWSLERLDASWSESLKQNIKDAPQTLWKIKVHPGPSTIFRVPGNIREVDQRAYEPRLLSLGPYHRDKPHLRPMEDLKWKYLRDFLSRGNPGRGTGTFDKCLGKLKSMETLRRARRAYSEKLEMDIRNFAEMLLLDGGFVLELFLRSRVSRIFDVGGDHIESDRGLLVDLLMIENQLPFFVLELLYDAVSHPGNLPLPELALGFLKLDERVLMEREFLSSEFLHLLHLFHSDVQSFALEYHYMNIRRRWIKPVKNSIPCATDLKEAGIKLRKKTDAASFLNVTFRGDYIDVPEIVANDDAKRLLRNMIAFERSFPDPVANHVTTYAALMDCIIKTVEDVKLLRSCGVISGASDEAAANFFSGLGKDLTSFEGTYLSGFAEDVNRYCSSGCQVKIQMDG